MQSFETGLPPRGGASLVPLASSLLAFGGANRTGSLFGDLTAIGYVGEVGSAGQPAPALSSHCVHASGKATDCRSGLRLTDVGGHAAEALTLPSAGGASTHMLLFGGINFAEQRVFTGLFEYAPGRGERELGRWRALGGALEERQHPRGLPAAAELGLPCLVRGSALPGGRTGHSLVHVPPPLLLPATCTGGGDDLTHLWRVPGYTGPVPTGSGAFSEPQGAEGAGGHEHAACALLFGGSTPEGGPLNDVWALRASLPTDAPAGTEWDYAWVEQATGGSQPTPRELHTAWVRPAVLQLASPLPEGGGSAQGWLPPSTLVRVLQPALLVVYGGRTAEEAAGAQADIAVCILDGGSGEFKWLPGCRATGAGGRASSAGAATPSGLHMLVYGGLTVAGDLSAELWHCDATNGVTAAHLAAPLDAETSLVPIPALDPARWPWGQIPTDEGAAQAGEEDEERPGRFAAAAAVLRGRGPSSPLQLIVFGGISYVDDLGDMLVLRLPAALA